MSRANTTICDVPNNTQRILCLMDVESDLHAADRLRLSLTLALHSSNSTGIVVMARGVAAKRVASLPVRREGARRAARGEPFGVEARRAGIRIGLVVSSAGRGQIVLNCSRTGKATEHICRRMEFKSRSLEHVLAEFVKKLELLPPGHPFWPEVARKNAVLRAELAQRGNGCPT